MRILASLAVLLLAQAIAGYAVGPAPRLQVSEGANNDGVMHFRLTPKDQAPIDVRVQLKDGRGEDGCSRDIREAFKAALDKKIYKIELDDGEDVLVKRRSGPPFAIELVESTVKGTRINFDRE